MYTDPYAVLRELVIANVDGDLPYIQLLNDSGHDMIDLDPDTYALSMEDLEHLAW